MELYPVSYSDLDQITRIEKETNEYPWSLNNFESSLDAGNSSIVLKDRKNIVGYAFFSVIGTDSHLLNITIYKDYQGKEFGFKRDAIRYNYYAGSPKEDALLMSKQGL